MPQFKNYAQSDDAPQVPEGWFFVELNRDKIKIVDNDGNSMMPYTRALVKKDSMSTSLVADGTLVVISESTVSLENYSEATFHNDALMALKMTMDATQPEIPVHFDAITSAEQVADEVVAAKDEQVKKARKKKSTDAGEAETPADEQITNSDAETSTIDTSASEEEPSV